MSEEETIPIYKNKEIYKIAQIIEGLYL